MPRCLQVRSLAAVAFAGILKMKVLVTCALIFGAFGSWCSFVTGEGCSNLTISPKTTDPILASQSFAFTCACTSEKGTICPKLIGIPDEELDIYQTGGNRAPNICTVNFNVTTEMSFHRIQLRAQMACQTEFELTDLVELQFNKSGNMGPCKDTLDCWSNEQICDSDGKCVCGINTTLAYITQLNKCYPASGYGERCEYSEQCSYGNPNATCNSDRICGCKENTFLNHEQKCVDASQIPNMKCEWYYSSIPEDQRRGSETSSVSCTCKSEDKLKPLVCPNLRVKSQEKFRIVETINANTNETCNVTWSIKPIEFDRPRVKITMECASGHNTTGNKTIELKKAEDSEFCTYDEDCWIKEQVCTNSTCVCGVSQTPAFVKEHQRCYPGAKLDQKCQYSEQCSVFESHSECSEGICKCSQKYKSDKSEKCVEEGSSSSWLSPNVAILIPAAILAVFSTKRTTVD